MAAVRIAVAQASAGASAPAIAAPVILYLNIERFRGIKALPWYPAAGVNVILGGGDVGKTTILDAIALLLAPTNATAVSGTDYFRRDIDAGFLIEALLSLPSSTGISDLTKPAWPWRWNGKNAVAQHGGQRGHRRRARLLAARSRNPEA
jgi:putative ATP-dependent endonuclease of OLD family